MTNSHKLKIGLDYHGVIDKNIDYFSSFCTKAKKRGHLIFIITGGPKVQVEYNLRINKIPYDMCFAVSDYYQAMGKVIQSENGNFMIPNHLWNMAKGEFCRRNQINIHIDDSTQYLNWFSTPYCYYDLRTNKGYISPDIEFDFNDSVDNILNKIEQIIRKLTCFV